MRSKFTPDSILQSIKGQVFSWKINQKELNSKLADMADFRFFYLEFKT